MSVVSLGAGVAIGYLIGTRSGKAKVDAGFDNVKRTAQETWEREDVQDFVSKATDTATKFSHEFADGAKKAAAAATEAVKKASEKFDDAEDTFADVVDEAESLVEDTAEEFASPETSSTGSGDVQSDPAQSTERKGTDWANEGGAKP